MSVKIRMTVVKISEEKGWQSVDGKMPNRKTIEFEVANTSDPKHPNYPYSFWSGGTKFPLMTINEEASKQFEVGKEYDILITPGNEEPLF